MKLAPHTSIREKYRPTPSAKEKRFHMEIMDQPCLICCATPCGVFHHLLTETPEKKWRRDHEMGLGLCHPCHSELHADGDEWAWCMSRGVDPVEEAIYNRDWGKRQKLL